MQTSHSKELLASKLADFIKHKFETTGTWPTEAELNEFLNRDIKPASSAPFERLAFDDNGL